MPDLFTCTIYQNEEIRPKGGFQQQLFIIHHSFFI